MPIVVMNINEKIMIYSLWYLPFRLLKDICMSVLSKLAKKIAHKNEEDTTNYRSSH